MPEAAAREGIPFQATVRSQDGRTKVGLMAAGPEVVRVWMEKQQGYLIDIYGDPERGYAGGYLP